MPQIGKPKTFVLKLLIEPKHQYSGTVDPNTINTNTLIAVTLKLNTLNLDKHRQPKDLNPQPGCCFQQASSAVRHPSQVGPHGRLGDSLLEGAGDLVRVPKGLFKGIYRLPQRDLCGLGFRVYRFEGFELLR